MRGVRGHRPGGGASGRGARLVARLIKTEAVVEGRTEVRWTLVEEDSTPGGPGGHPRGGTRAARRGGPDPGGAGRPPARGGRGADPPPHGRGPPVGVGP